MTASPEKLPLTPENTPVPQKLALPETFEQTMQQVKDLSDALENRIKKATTDSEREKYSGLLTKLKQSFVLKSGETVDGTQESIAKLRNEVSPDQQKLLQDVAHAVKHGVEASVTVAKQSTSEVVAAGKKAAEALQNGNIDDAKKQLEGIKETVNAAGQKVMEFSGMKAFEKILEPLQTQGIVGIFAVIANFFKFLTGGLKWSEVVGEASGKAEKTILAGKEKIPEISAAVTQGAKEAERFLLEKEYRNGLIEKSLPSLYEKLSKEFFEGGNMSDKQKADLKEILQNASYGQDTVSKIKSRIENGNLDLAKASDLSDLILEIGFGNINILWELMSRGVIPLSRVAVHTIETANNSYKFNVGIVFQRLNLPNPPFISLSSEELAVKMKDADPKLKDFLLVEMYRVNGFMASILGTAAGLSASLTNALLVDTSTKVDGIQMFKANFNGKFDVLLKDIEILEKAVLGQNVGGVEKSIAQNLRDHFTQIKQNFTILEQLKADPTNQALKNQVKTMNDPFKLKNTLGQLLGTKAGMASEYLDSLYEIQKYQVAVAQKDILSRSRGLFGSFEILKMPRMADRFMLHFPSPEAAKKTLQQMAAYGPEFLQSFFRSLPVAGLVIAGYDVASSSDSEKNSVISFLGEASKILIPFVGPLSLFFSDTHGPKIARNKETGSVEIENMGTGFLAAGMLGVDTVLLANAIRTGKLAQFATSRITDVAKFGGDLIKYGNVGLKSIEKLSPQLGRLFPMIQTLPKKLKIAAVFAITLGGSAYAYASSHKDIEKQLIADGFWDGRSENITPKLKEQFTTMNIDDKRLFLDGLFVTFVEKKENSLPETESFFHKGVYTLVTKKTEDMSKIWEALNAHETKFGEELRTLGIELKVATKEVV